MTKVKQHSVLEIIRSSLVDRPQLSGYDLTENEVRYKLIIDPSEDDSLIRLLFSFGVLDRERTKMFVCSDFPGDGQLQKVKWLHACAFVLHSLFFKLYLPLIAFSLHHLVFL